MDYKTTNYKAPGMGFGGLVLYSILAFLIAYLWAPTIYAIIKWWMGW